MKRLFLSLILISTAFAGWFSSPEPQNTLKPATIKVLLKKHCDGALIEAKGSFEVINPQDHKHLSSGWKGKRFFLYPHAKGIKWGEDFPGIYQLRIVPKSSETTFLVDGVQYRGCLEVYHIDGAVQIVNEVDVENYLKSILTTQFAEQNLRPEVMDALSIAARTNAYHMIMRSVGAFWHVDAASSGYNGYGITLQNLNVDRSVDATRYLVMAFEGRPFPATWTANCAGKTGSFRDIFRKNISCPKGVKTPYAAKVRDEHTWTYKFAKEKLAHIAKTNRVTDIDLFVDDASGKTYALRIKDGSHESNVDFFALQESLGPDNIKSNDFTVKIDGNDVIIQGYGEGTGSGLCIFSATQMAEKGEMAPEILASFYPFTHLQQQQVIPNRNSIYEEHHVINDESDSEN